MFYLRRQCRPAAVTRLWAVRVGTGVSKLASSGVHRYTPC